MTATWRPPADLADEVRTAAHRTRRSANAIINEAVRDWLTAHHKKEEVADETAAVR